MTKRLKKDKVLLPIEEIQDLATYRTMSSVIDELNKHREHIRRLEAGLQSLLVDHDQLKRKFYKSKK